MDNQYEKMFNGFHFNVKIFNFLLPVVIINHICNK